MFVSKQVREILGRGYLVTGSCIVKILWVPEQVQGSTEMSRKLLRKTSQELSELQKQIQVLKGQQEKVQKEESSNQVLL